MASGNAPTQGLTADEQLVLMETQRLDDNFSQSQFAIFDVDKLWTPHDSIPKTDGYTLCGIHPIFAAKNFPDADFGTLFASITLASKLIQTDCLLGYWAANFCKPIELHPHYSAPGVYVDTLPWIPDGTVLDQGSLNTIKIRLNEMANVVTFQRHNAGIVDLGATTDLIPGPRPQDPFTNPAFVGGNVVIQYSDVRYQELHGLVQQSRAGRMNAEDRDKLLYHRFSFAVTLVHELAHAAQNLLGIRRPFDVPFGNQIAAEAGFDWEQSVFGGRIQPADAFNDVEMISWPSPGIMEAYMLGGHTMRIQGPITETTALHFRVPQGFVKQLFKEEFWDTVVPAQGYRALRIPRLLAWRWLVGSQACTNCTACAQWRNGDMFGLGSHGDPFGIALKRAGCKFGYLYHCAMYNVPSHVGIPAGFNLLADHSVVAAEHDSTVRLAMEEQYLASKRQKDPRPWPLGLKMFS